MLELRCPSKLQGTVEGHFLEVACTSSFCGKEAGVVVLHRYDLLTGKLVETKRYKSPRASTTQQEDTCP